MTQRHEHEHGKHHQEQSEEHSQQEVRDAGNNESNKDESILDELEKAMFERAR